MTKDKNDKSTIQKISEVRYDSQWIKRSALIALADILAVWAAFFCALWIRFDFSVGAIPDHYFNQYVYIAPLWCILTVVVFYIARLYHSVWSFVSINEIITMVKAYAVLSIIFVATKFVFSLNMPRSFWAFGILFGFLMHTGIRFSYRMLRFIKYSYSSGRDKRMGEMTQVMIIGGGDSCAVLLREMLHDGHLNQNPVCIIDDNPSKVGRELYGVPIVGGRDKIVEKAAEYSIDLIIFAIPTATPKERSEILNICKETGARLKTLPGIYQLVNGEVNVSRLRDVEVEDLLGRDPIAVDMDSIAGYVQNKVVMVTGGGGSIGSELCRQIAQHKPKKLIIVDIYENNAYEIQQELKTKYPDLNLIVLIASVRNTLRMNTIFEQYKPDIVYRLISMSRLWRTVREKPSKTTFLAPGKLLWQQQ